MTEEVCTLIKHVMSREYIPLMIKVGRSVYKIFDITATDSYGRATKRSLEKLENAQWIPERVREYALDMNGHLLRWESREDGSGRSACTGDVNLLPIDQIYGDWEGIVYFDFTENPRLRHFKIVDFFVNEACVGLYYDEQQDPGLYYLEHGEGLLPYPLHLDLKGYLTLLTCTLGYSYWQLAVLALLPDDGHNPAYRANLSFTEESAATWKPGCRSFHTPRLWPCTSKYGCVPWQQAPERRSGDVSQKCAGSVLPLEAVCKVRGPHAEPC